MSYPCGFEHLLLNGIVVTLPDDVIALGGDCRALLLELRLALLDFDQLRDNSWVFLIFSFSQFADQATNDTKVRKISVVSDCATVNCGIRGA